MKDVSLETTRKVERKLVYLDLKKVIFNNTIILTKDVKEWLYDPL